LGQQKSPEAQYLLARLRKSSSNDAKLPDYLAFSLKTVPKLADPSSKLTENELDSLVKAICLPPYDVALGYQLLAYLKAKDLAFDGLKYNGTLLETYPTNSYLWEQLADFHREMGFTDNIGGALENALRYATDPATSKRLQAALAQIKKTESIWMDNSILEVRVE
jgi:hypothetical protein